MSIAIAGCNLQQTSRICRPSIELSPKTLERIYCKWRKKQLQTYDIWTPPYLIHADCSVSTGTGAVHCYGTY